MLLGINPGLIWSFENGFHRHYRQFSLPKGRRSRQIDAPRVALKIIQKWLSVHLQKTYRAPEHVFGFVPGRSHVMAAGVHCGARWIYSIDITDFFPSTPLAKVENAFVRIGYGADSSHLLARLCCLRGFLAQGAPTSPVVSNITFYTLDQRLIEIAGTFDVKLTRYADDIVFSGTHGLPESIIQVVKDAFTDTPWRLSEKKSKLSKSPQRLKVHGLLVHGEKIRLTKGYRNKIRAYQHLLSKNGVSPEDINKIRGHMRYANYISLRGGAPPTVT